MKVIDLLVKIANKEILNNVIYITSDNTKCENVEKLLQYVGLKDDFYDLFDIIESLNSEVRIIEEDAPKKIKKMAISNYEETFGQFELDVTSINKIIDKINDLEK